jgi:hypothetical protein
MGNRSCVPGRRKYQKKGGRASAWWKFAGHEFGQFYPKAEDHRSDMTENDPI